MRFKLVLISFILVPFVWGIWPLLVILLYWRDARRRRASDVVLDELGIEIRGGPRSGTSLAWLEIDPVQTRVEQTEELFVKEGDSPAVYMQRLLVSGMEVARGADRQEVASLRTVAALIAEAARGATERITPRVTVAQCPSCGAPLTPVDDPTTCCAHCGDTIAVPHALRTAARETAAIDAAHRRVDAAVRRALTGGSSKSANRAIAGLALTGHSVLPVAFVALEARDLVLVLVPVALTFAVGAFAWSVISKRIAVRGLALGCAALAPSDPGHPPLCRRCCAPLRVGGSAAIATCAYCRTTNVIGLALGGFDPHRDTLEVRRVLERHTRDRVLCAMLEVAALALGAWALGSFMTREL